MRRPNGELSAAPGMGCPMPPIAIGIELAGLRGDKRCGDAVGPGAHRARSELAFDGRLRRRLAAAASPTDCVCAVEACARRGDRGLGLHSCTFGVLAVFVELTTLPRNAVIQASSLAPLVCLWDVASARPFLSETSSTPTPQAVRLSRTRLRLPDPRSHA